MKKPLMVLHKAVMGFLKWCWPLVLLNAALDAWRGAPHSVFRHVLNNAAFIWILCVPVAPITFLLNRSWRERAMAWLCGLREGDERERVVTGEAARATLLLALSIQTVLLVMTLVNCRFEWDPRNLPKGEKHGLISVGLGLSSSQHFDPFGSAQENKSNSIELGAASPTPGTIQLGGGWLIAPSAFPILALLILIQVFAFKRFAVRGYEGADV